MGGNPQRPDNEVEQSALEDTQGAVAATAEYIVVVFRGTQEPSDWATNLKFFQADFPALSQPLEVCIRLVRTLVRQWHHQHETSLCVS